MSEECDTGGETECCDYMCKIVEGCSCQHYYVFQDRYKSVCTKETYQAWYAKVDELQLEITASGYGLKAKKHHCKPFEMDQLIDVTCIYDYLFIISDAYHLWDGQSLM